jgi:hypothetical protein
LSFETTLGSFRRNVANLTASALAAFEGARRAAVHWLERTALNAMTAGQGELEPREVRFGTTRGSLSKFLLRRSWRYWLAKLNLHLTVVPLPNAAAAALDVATRQQAPRQATGMSLPAQGACRTEIF